MDPTHPHQRSRPTPVEPLAPSAVERARGAAGCALLTVSMGVAVAASVALVLVVAAIVAITTLG